MAMLARRTSPNGRARNAKIDQLSDARSCSRGRSERNMGLAYDSNGDQRAHAGGELLDVLLDSVDVAVVACDLDGIPTHLNRRAVELIGMDASDDAAPSGWVNQVHPRTVDGRPIALHQLPIVRALGGEVVRDFDLIVRTPKGELLLSTTANPVHDARGVRIGAVAVFADVTAQRTREAEVEEELTTLGMARSVQQALAEDRLLLYAQPIVAVPGGETVLSELLLRVRERDGKVVGPGKLLTAAERHGVVASVDEWVFEHAVQIAATGRAVTVNVSAQTVVRSGFADAAETMLARHGAPPSLITLEITETAVVSDIVAATRFAERLERVGCRFALDDFGTGYAALTYLKHLPLSYLKIDVDFVRDLCENERSRAVVSGVVALARGFGLQTIAEGVEDRATLELLRELGVDLAQGFYLGRPRATVSSLPAPARRPFAASPRRRKRAAL
jgi:EAL domain-containing protein (putative c-di-GMP-specific phosphodiesterase class I)